MSTTIIDMKPQSQIHELMEQTHITLVDVTTRTREITSPSDQKSDSNDKTKHNTHTIKHKETIVQ